MGKCCLCGKSEETRQLLINNIEYKFCEECISKINTFGNEKSRQYVLDNMKNIEDTTLKEFLDKRLEIHTIYKKWILIITILCMALIMFAILFKNLIYPFVIYRTAINDYNNGDYLTSFRKLNGIENKFKGKEEIHMEVQYSLAIQYMENKEFDLALILLEELGNYKNTNNFIAEIKYLKAMQYFENKDYNNAIMLLEEISNYKDVQSELKEAKYNFALVLYNDYGKKAMKIFEELNDYKDSKKLLNELKVLHQFDGTWYGSVVEKGSKYISAYYKWIFDGNKCYNVFSNEKAKNDYQRYYCEYDNGVKIYLNEYFDTPLYYYRFINDTLVCEIKGYLSTKIVTLEKISDDTTLPKTTYTKEPTIGMTAEEVKKSTWGTPKDINKTTTRYGVSEQWVYSDYRYLYFEDGILTSISE